MYLRALIASFAILWSTAAVAPARAADAVEKNVVSLGLKGGVAFPQLASSLGTTFHVHLEAAYHFPVWGSRLGIMAAVGYSQPSASGSGEDPRLPDGTYEWEMTQRQTTLDLGLILKFFHRESDFNLGLCAGARIVFLSTLTSGAAGGEPFGEHDEQATLPGMFAGLQAEYLLGPGALFGEVSFGATFEDLRTTGELMVPALGVLAGYRFVFSI